MQDEPEAGPGFSCKMSLKASSEMLGIDHQHGRFKSKQPGADSGVSGRECARPVCRARTRRSVRLGGEHPGSARVRQTRESREGTGAALHGADDRPEPGAAHASDHLLPHDGAGQSSCVSADEVRHPLHGSRCGPTGLCRQGSWEPERAGDTANPGARVRRIWANGLRAPGRDFGGASVSTAQLGSLPQTQCELSADAAHADPDRRAAQATAERHTRIPAHRHSASGRSRWLQRHLSHQRRGSVTQWEIVAAVPQISEFWLIPVLEAILMQFPFVILGFHSDNGSEFINYTVARLLSKLLIEQTKSRAHHTGDNGLVEYKNGAIIRKHIGFGYINARHAGEMDVFHRQHLNPYINFHRPCAVPKILTEANGKRSEE